MDYLEKEANMVLVEKQSTKFKPLRTIWSGLFCQGTLKEIREIITCHSLMYEKFVKYCFYNQRQWSDGNDGKKADWKLN